jgi:ankyrin repeat protein
MYTRDEMGRKLLYDLSTGNLKEAFAEVAQGARLDLRNGDGATALNIAASCGHAGMVQRLIECGVDVNQQDNRRDTPLMWAADNGQLDAVEKLLAAGAQVDARNIDNQTAKDLAQASGHARVVKALLDVEIANRRRIEESWNGIVMDTGRDIRVSKPIQLKLGHSFVRI